MAEQNRNIKVILAYDGTDYCGWQRQNGQPTVQGTLEEKLSLMCGENISLHGAGRTDAGVHALAMVANFHTSSTIPCIGFLRGLNSMLPADIRLLAVEAAAVDFHARRSAVSKTYHYVISNCPEQLPTRRLYAVHVGRKLDLTAMRACLEILVGTHDFASFEAAGSRDPSVAVGRGAVREIFSARLEESSGQPGEILLTVNGDGFLRHMVRNIVGTLIEVGCGYRDVSDFEAILAARNRALAGPTAPAHGLFLQEVHYNELER